MNGKHHFPSDPKYATEYSQRLPMEDLEEGLPSPSMKRKGSERSGNYEQFSERLVESINMVRELLKSNK